MRVYFTLVQVFNREEKVYFQVFIYFVNVRYSHPPFFLLPRLLELHSDLAHGHLALKAVHYIVYHDHALFVPAVHLALHLNVHSLSHFFHVVNLLLVVICYLKECLFYDFFIEYSSLLRLSLELSREIVISISY